MNRTLVSEVKNKVGESVTLFGWVQNNRAMGKMTFVDLRDRTGFVQAIALKEELSEEIWKIIKEVTLESAVKLTGIVQERPSKDQQEGSNNYEIQITEFEILNKANALPIPTRGDGYDINEEARLKYRYLDIRRDRLTKTLRKRAEFVQNVREALINQDFVEIETPILTASTKEGARDFVVPSRINPGKFYALPQSPQQYKQLLMAGGIENYFQIARCIRDEDLRADRGFEHSQIDIETSFREEEEIREVVEKALSQALTKSGAKLREGNFEVINYKDALEKYGDDKFDIRTEEEKQNGTLAFAWVVNYPMFKKVDSADAAEVQDGKSGWTFTHNPFSGIKKEHEEWHLKQENIEQITATQYDLVCNGYEIGSGSKRAHNPEILRSTFRIMGYSEEQIEENVGHMLRAFELGTPPHGGIAFGVERLVMLLTGEKSLKETVAFPMTYNGRTAVMDGPSELSQQQIKDLGLDELGEKRSVVEKVHEFLDSKNIEFDKFEHEPTPTSEDSARVRGTNMEEGIKALILKGKNSGKNIMINIPSHLKLDMSAIKNQFGEAFEFEKPEKIKQKYNVIVGGVPPLGMVMGIETYFDSKIFENEKVAFNSGTQTNSVVMKASDLNNLVEESSIGNFSK